MVQLYREAALEHSQRRLEGSIILRTPISITVLSFLAGVIIFSFVVFSCVLTYGRTENVPGWLVPNAGLIRIKARQEGTISALSVSEGARLEAGDRVALLHSAAMTPAGDAGHLLDANLKTEAAGNKEQAAAEELLLESQNAELVHRRTIYLDELEEAQSRIRLAEERQAFTAQQIKRSTSLLEKGFMSKNGMDSLSENLLSEKSDASAARAAALALEGQISDLSQEIKAGAIIRERVEAESKQAQASIGQRVIAASAENNSAIVSPVAGQVVAIAVNTGQEVQASSTVAVLSPRGSRLIAELFVPSRAIGFIKPGQAVELMYDPYPFQRFGAGKGFVRMISQAALRPDELAEAGLDLKEPVYLVKVDLTNQKIWAYGLEVPLKPGIQLRAKISIYRKSLMMWFFEPLFAAGRS